MLRIEKGILFAGLMISFCHLVEMGWNDKFEEWNGMYTTWDFFFPLICSSFASIKRIQNNE